VDAAEQYFCEHGVNVAQSLKVWGVLARKSASQHVFLADSLAAVHRLDECHGQPGSVFSAHEVRLQLACCYYWIGQPQDAHFTHHTPRTTLQDAHVMHRTANLKHERNQSLRLCFS
jgi:hypothetical protein